MNVRRHRGLVYKRVHLHPRRMSTHGPSPLDFAYIEKVP
uniref:Uncharacterized protein n=1 Tax=Anguilla anguilla TaxID=7936 RepID=A0A0E9V2A1_ANGAN